MHRFPVGWVFCFVFLPLFSIAQQFVNETLPIERSYGLAASEAHWADIDQDGDWDLFLNRPYRNDGSVFSILNSFSNGVVYDWGDFNRDGRLDRLGIDYSGGDFTDKAGRVTNISPYNGCEFIGSRGGDLTLLRGKFNPVSSFYDVNYTPSGGVWGDNDQDGDDDIVFSSRDSSQYFHTRLFHWQEGKYQVIDTLPVKGAGKELFWQDMDRDGDLDLLMNAEEDRNTSVAYVLKNTNGTYQAQTLPASYYSVVDHVRWGDLDGDGDLDLIQVGHNGFRQFSSGLEIALFENGQYQWIYQEEVVKLNQNADEHDVLQGLSVEIGDLDNDGQLDIAVFAGFSLFRFLDRDRLFLRLYRNQGNLAFQADKDLDLDHYDERSRYSLLDYDHDGDLDISRDDQLWRNTLSKINAKPSVPTGLVSLINGQVATLSWQPATDDLTPKASLTYNVHIYTEKGPQIYLNGLSNLTNGHRSILKPGNATTLIEKVIRNLPDGKYFWTVQAIDQNYSASTYAGFQSFTIAHGTSSAASIELTQPLMLNTCECAQISLGVKPSGTFGSDNRFLVQLSDTNGNFQHPITLHNQLDNHRSDVPVNENGLWEKKALAWLPQSVQRGTRYRVRIMSTNPIVLSADNGYNIAIKKLPQLAEISTPDSELCFNPPNTLLRLSQLSQFANEYEWEIQPVGAGVFIRYDSIAEVDWSNTFIGKVQIRVRGRNGCGNGPMSAPVTLNITPAPLGAGPITTSYPICPGQENVAFEIEAIAGAHSYQWKLPAGVTVKAGTPTNTNRILLHMGDNFQKGTLEVAGLTDCGAGKSSLLPLELPAKILTGGKISGEDTLCSGLSSVTFTVNPIAAATQYVWQIPPGFIPNGQQLTTTPTIVLQVAGRDFRDTLWVQGINACFSGPLSVPFVVTVLSAPAQPEMVTGPLQVCSDQSIVSYRTKAVKGSVNYRWVLPTGVLIAGESNNLLSPDITVRVTESFVGGSIQVIAINPCGQSAASLPITVLPYRPLEQPTITQSCNQLAIDLIEGAKIQWYLDQVPLAGAVHVKLDIVQSGEYTVQLQGYCDTLSATLKATAFLLNREDIPNVLTPNGDERNETFRFNQANISQLVVYNRWGKVVYQSKHYQNDWSGEQLPTGVYYYFATVDCLASPIRGTVELLR